MNKPSKSLRWLGAGAALLLLLIVLSLLFWPEPEEIDPETPEAEEPTFYVEPTADPEDAAIRPLALRGDDYKFQDHNEVVSFEYQPPISPHKLLRMLEPVARTGHYPGDYAGTLRAENRTPAKDPVSLGTLRWHSKRRTLPDLLGALRDEVAPTFAADHEEGPEGFSSALHAASTVDAATVRGLAQMRLRLAEPDPSKLTDALDTLALCLWRERRHGELERLLQAGPDYRPAEPELTEELAQIFDPHAAGEDFLMKMRLAIACGDTETARTALEALPEEKRCQYGELYIERIENGLTAGLDEEGREKLEKHFTQLREVMEGYDRPTAERFADWSDEQILKWLRWSRSALGGETDAPADALLYLLEEREFDGGDLTADVAIQAGFRARGRRERARAVALFALTQKLAYPPYPPGTLPDGYAMIKFNGFEASIYAAKHFSPIQERVGDEEVREEIIEAILDMLDYSIRHCTDEDSAGIAGRPGYLEMAFTYKWRLEASLYGYEAVLPELRELIERPPELMYRYWARNRLGNYLERLERYEDAMNEWRAFARGREGALHINRGIRKMAFLGDRTGRIEWIEEAIELGREAVEAIETGDLKPKKQSPEFVKETIEENGIGLAKHLKSRNLY